LGQDSVGIVGIGIMGGAMMRNLLKDGFHVVGYDIAQAACARLAEAGGEPVASAREVAERASVVITSLPSAAALAATADGIAAAASADQVVIECSTLPLDAKEGARQTLATTGKTLLDCPVSGTGAQAARKDLVVFASGDEAAFRRCLPVFAGMSRAQKYLGAFGNGSKMKFIANHLVTIHNVAAAEAMVLGLKAGLDPHLVSEVIGDSAGASRMLQVRGPLMADARYDEATATIRTHLKDVDIIGRFAGDLGCPTPLFAASVPFYLAGASQGRALQDTAAVCAVLEDMAGLPPRQ
jgi:3-hydroxyisobutyrate dehydrogenase